MNLFNKALILTGCFVISFLMPSSAQEPNWLVEPFLGNTKDLINIYLDLELIHFERDGKQGVVNFKNEVILPAKYDKIKVFESVSYIYAKQGREDLHYDYEGYELEETFQEEAMKSESEMIRELRAVQADDFNLKNPNFKVVETEETEDGKNHRMMTMRYALLSQQGDTLVKKIETLDNLLMLGTDHVAHQGKRADCIVFHKSGEIVFEDDYYYTSAKMQNGKCVISRENSYVVYDENMKLISDEYKFVYPFKSGNCFYHKIKRDYFLLDNDGKPVNEIVYKRISEIEDTKYILLEELESKMITVFDTENVQFVELEYQLQDRNRLGLGQIALKDDRLGVINIDTKETMIPFEFDKIVVAKDRFKAYKVLSKDEEELRDYKIFDQSGKLLFEVTAYKFYDNGDCFVVTKDAEGKSYAVSLGGELLLEAKKDNEKVSPGRNGWVKIKKDQTPTNYLVSELLSGDAKGFLNTGGMIKGSEDGVYPTLYIASESFRKEKMGAIDKDGNVILPLVYSDLAVKKLCGQKYLTASLRPNGPIGIIQKWH